MSGTKKESHWIPLADLMTVLMIIFLFMSVSYMTVVKIKQQQQNKLFKDYEATKIALYKQLKEVFKSDTSKWNMKLESDLSIKFTNPQVLFDDGKSDIKPIFQNILKEFIPKYLSVVMNDTIKEQISEIRIEGHTNTRPINKTNDPYIDNMELSQNRARNVLAYFRQQDCFKKLDSTKKERLQYWLTANGLSYGRTLDDNYKISFESKQLINQDNSRRVEFRIITTSESIINQALKKLK